MTEICSKMLFVSRFFLKSQMTLQKSWAKATCGRRVEADTPHSVESFIPVKSIKLNIYE